MSKNNLKGIFVASMALVGICCASFGSVHCAGEALEAKIKKAAEGMAALLPGKDEAKVDEKFKDFEGKVGDILKDFSPEDKEKTMKEAADLVAKDQEKAKHLKGKIEKDYKENSVRFSANGGTFYAGMNLEFSKGIGGVGVDVASGGVIGQKFKKCGENSIYELLAEKNNDLNKVLATDKDAEKFAKEKFNVLFRPYAVIYFGNFFLRAGYTGKLALYGCNCDGTATDQKAAEKISKLRYSNGFNVGLGYAITKNVAIFTVFDMLWSGNSAKAETGSSGSDSDKKIKLSKGNSLTDIIVSLNIVGRFAHSSGFKAGIIFGGGYDRQAYKFESREALNTFQTSSTSMKVKPANSATPQ